MATLVIKPVSMYLITTTGFTRQSSMITVGNQSQLAARIIEKYLIQVLTHQPRSMGGSNIAATDLNDSHGRVLFVEIVPCLLLEDMSSWFDHSG